MKTSTDNYILVQDLLITLPARMRAARFKMPSHKGYRPGIRGAAKSIGVSPTTYYRIENGGTPDTDTFVKILKWIGTFK